MPILTIHQSSGILELEVPKGSNLRKVLLDQGISPYARMTRKAEQITHRIIDIYAVPS